MQKIILYRAIKENGVVSVSPIKPDSYDSILYRLVADDGKELVNGDIRVYCIDTDDLEQWVEEDEVIGNDYAN